MPRIGEEQQGGTEVVLGGHDQDRQAPHQQDRAEVTQAGELQSQEALAATENRVRLLTSRAAKKISSMILANSPGWMEIDPG